MQTIVTLGRPIRDGGKLQNTCYSVRLQCNDVSRHKHFNAHRVTSELLPVGFRAAVTALLYRKC